MIIEYLKPILDGDTDNLITITLKYSFVSVKLLSYQCPYLHIQRFLDWFEKLEVGIAV